MNDYLIICRSVYTAQPEIFIAKPAEITYKILKKRIHEKGKTSYWFSSGEYERFAGKWEIIEEIGV